MEENKKPFAVGICDDKIKELLRSEIASANGVKSATKYKPENLQETVKSTVPLSESLSEHIPKQKDQSSKELKCLIRNQKGGLAKKHDSKNGEYMHYFKFLRAKTEEELNSLENLEKTLYEMMQFLDKNNKSPEETYKKLEILWNELNKENTSDDRPGKKESQVLLWKLVLKIAQGVIQVNKETTENKDIFYTSFASGEDFKKRLRNKTRNSAVQKFREIIGNKFEIKPHIEKLIKQTDNLSEEDKKSILDNLKSKQSSIGGENFSLLLTRDAEILSFAETDYVDNYFKTIGQYFSYLEKNISQQGQDQTHNSNLKYLQFLKDSYLNVLKEYCHTMRKSKEANPYIADLLLEPYLLRLELFDGVNEPSALHLLDKWQEQADCINENLKNDHGETFYFVATYEKTKRSSRDNKINKTRVFLTPKSKDATKYGMPTLNKIVEDTENNIDKTLLGLPETEKSFKEEDFRKIAKQNERGIKEKGKSDHIEKDDWRDVWRQAKLKICDDDGDKSNDLNLDNPEHIEKQLKTIIMEASYNTIRRGDEVSVFLDKLDDDQKKVAIQFLHRKIRREFNAIMQSISKGKTDLIKNSGQSCYQLIMYIYGRYFCIEEIKKIFCLELAKFYRDLDNQIIKSPDINENLRTIMNTLFIIVQNSHQMSKDTFYSLRKEKIISEETDKSGELPNIKALDFPDLTENEVIKGMLSEDQNDQILKIKENITCILEQIRNMESFFDLQERLETSENQKEEYISILKEIRSHIITQKKEVRKLHKKLKGNWIKRTFLKKRAKTDTTDESIERLYTYIDKSWKESILPAYLLFGNILLGEKSQKD